MHGQNHIKYPLSSSSWNSNALIVEYGTEIMTEMANENEYERKMEARRGNV